MESKKVLIVDDTVQILSLMKRAIRKIDYCKVDTAASGDEAVALFREAVQTGTPYDLVVMDREMPGKSGEIVLMELREIYPEVRAILHTGDKASEVYLNYTEFGFAGVLDKPSDNDVINHVVIHFLNN